MTTAEYVQNGKHIEFIAKAKTEYQEIVVIGSRIGIAETALEIGESGTIAVEGVFNLPAKSDLAVKQGEIVYYNSTTGQIEEKTDTTVAAGWAVEDKVATQTTISVKIG